MAEVICPTGCEDALPIFSFDDCAPEFNRSEIRWLYLSLPTAESFTDVEDPTEWATRLVDELPAEPTGDEIIAVRVIGSKPLATANEIVTSHGTVNFNPEHSITFRIDDTNQANYDAMRLIQCGLKLKFWYGTTGGKIYGGNDGVIGSFTIGDQLDEGEDSLEIFSGTVTWRSQQDPDRGENPIYKE